jgi:hypothetical protein
MPPVDETNNPFAPIVSQWMEKIKAAKKQKHERFGKYAEEAMNFYDGNHDWMWKGEYAKAPGGFLDKKAEGAMPTFRMTVNRVFEAVALFGPVLYHRNPTILVTPRLAPTIDPSVLGINPEDKAQIQQFQQLKFSEDMENEKKRAHAKIREHYLNWLQQEQDKKKHARAAINEAIIKGMGLLWTEMYQPRGSKAKHPRSTFMSVDDLVVDPDASYWEDVEWIARKVVHPVWRVEREYGLEDLKGSMKSLASQGENFAKNRIETSGEKRRGKSFDLIEYWQVFSKGGFGDRLRTSNKAASERKFNYEQFGDFCYLAVSEDIPYPLNMPPESLKESDEDLFMRAQWPIPFWTDGGWPFAKLHFYEKPKEIWPISLIKPAIGELRFVNWCMSFLADKVAASSTTYVAIAKAAGAEIQDQLKSGLGPYTHIEISEVFGRSVNDVVSFLDAPSFNVDIWRMVSEVLDMIDKRTGLTELLYGLGGSTQIRSATEADVRNQNVAVRPDDMASRVEDWLSESALKEIEAAEWLLTGQDVSPIIGNIGAMVWESQLSQQDFEKVVMEYDYRVEAGSARKPNKTNKIRQLNDFGQIAMPVMQEFVGMGISGPYNAFLTDWAKANEIDAAPYIIDIEELKAQKQQEEQGQEDPEAQAQQQQMQMQQQMAQLDMQAKQMDMQIKQAEAQIKQQEAQANQATTGVDQQKAQQAVQADQQKAQQSMQLEQQKLQIDQASHQQELQQDSEVHLMEMEQAAEKHRLDIELMKEKTKALKEQNQERKTKE